MRWLLAKDLRILRRSPLLVVLLVLYPVVIALLIGFALSRGPDRPRVGIVNLVPPGETIDIGASHISIDEYLRQLQTNVVPVPYDTRAQAVSAVRSGDVLAAIVIPADIVNKLSSGLSQAQVEVIYNGDAIKQSYVQSTIDSALANANQQLSARLAQAAAQYIDVLLHGGSVSALGTSVSVVGLQATKQALDALLAREPPGPERDRLEAIDRFAAFAVQYFGLSKGVIASVGQPVTLQRTLLSGRRTPLDSYAVAIVVSVSLMFVCMLLAAGSLALEREDHALPRLVRGLVSREMLLVEKVLLAGACAFLVTLVMLAGIGAFVGLSWGRFPQWLVGLAGGAVAFGALGVAIGAVAPEVRSASLLSFTLSLPLAFLALVPSGAVSRGLDAVINVISAVFPFKAALQAMDAALNGSSPSLGVSILHLLVLAVVFGVIARLGLRRLA